MILQAFKDFPKIDRNQSFMIGDSIRDIEAGISAGLGRNILLADSYYNDNLSSALKSA